MDPTPRLDRDAWTERLRAVWTSLLGRDVADADDFFDAGGDSLGALRLLAQLQSTYRIELDAPAFFEAPSLQRLVDIVLAAQTAQVAR
jgi:acyl carrier protein